MAANPLAEKAAVGYSVEAETGKRMEQRRLLALILVLLFAALVVAVALRIRRSRRRKRKAKFIDVDLFGSDPP